MCLLPPYLQNEQTIADEIGCLVYVVTQSGLLCTAGTVQFAIGVLYSLGAKDSGMLGLCNYDFPIIFRM